MRKAAGKRPPHGATSTLVLAALWCLHMQTGRPKPVSRAAVVQALELPETTVDDRLRVLVKLKQALKVGRGLYSPIHQKEPANWGWNRRQLPPPDWYPPPGQDLSGTGVAPQQPGTRNVRVFPEGVVRIEQWLSVADYIRLESRRQRLAILGLADDHD